MKAPNSVDNTLVLDARASGELLHHLLDHAVRHIEASGRLGIADVHTCNAALEHACTVVAASWEAGQAVPPGVVWRRTLDDTKQVALAALRDGTEPLPGQRSFTEAPFGGQPPKSDGRLPWDPQAPVEIVEAGFRISGYIDRLDLSDCGARARVVDYKGGRCPKPASLDGGKELQRCLYTYAVRALLGAHVEVEAALVYPREGEVRPLDDCPGTLQVLTDALSAARENLAAGRALLGPDTAHEYDDLAFALPAMADKGWCKRKSEPARVAMGDAVLVWEAN